MTLVVVGSGALLLGTGVILSYAGREPGISGECRAAREAYDADAESICAKPLDTPRGGFGGGGHAVSGYW